MYPTICKIGPLTIHSYGVMMALAAIVCSLLMVRDAKRINMKSEEIYDLVFWTLIGGIIGARIFYLILNFAFFIHHPVEIVMIQHGGLAWQGGVVFGALTVILFSKFKGLPLSVLADFVAPYLALGHAIGRIGCFLNGCCYGKPVSWGIYFPVHHARLHPTQLYEMVLLIILFFGLKKAQQKMKDTPGAVFALYLVFAPIIRFAVEFFRADHRPLFLGLSIFQYVGLVFFAVGVILFRYVRRKK